MRDEKPFVDTNVIVYAFTDDPRTAAAEALMKGGCVVSVQSLNEFASVATRKIKMPWKKVRQVLDAMRTLCPSPRAITIETHDLALTIAARYGYHIYDSLLIAAALQSSCRTLYSEDMHHGQTINGLRIHNPFHTIAVH
jgi:predicted nucleic acid-binding protein